jgi:hypothetical protein
MLFTAISTTKPRKKDKKLVTEDFKDVLVYLIMAQLIYIKKNHNKYGELVICLDNSSKSYWRKEVCSLYKAQRAAHREESEVNFDEVFEVINDLLINLRESFPFKILDITKAEADDIIIVLSRTFASSQNRVLIYSEDKDFFQMLKYTGIDFYRPVAKKWVTLEDKPMDTWLLEHVCLGDEADNVFKVNDRIYFSENFKLHLLNFGITDKDDKMQLDMYLLDKPTELEENIYSTFTVYKKNRKGENTPELDIFKDIRFGASTLQTAIKKAGSLDNWLDSHPYIRKNYDKNKILVLEEYIPKELEDAILDAFNTPQKDYSLLEIENFFAKYQLNQLMKDINLLIKDYSARVPSTASDFGWDF